MPASLATSRKLILRKAALRIQQMVGSIYYRAARFFVFEAFCSH